ncbi:VOC family protein [Aeromicrobium endophyticum]|uniref:VOC family protein n=1 Tax=Aeromicrobium endophyticum TaxID=2292704 RepID=A0A371P5U8_9ACTN|nr:VOC family protein [Aeromicrobium endophyticum]REK70846.1 VOC family protein [Aeromicrobium endophyticum]
MSLVTFKDLCLDANDVSALEGFWARALHLDGEISADDGSGVLRGGSPGQTVWINPVPEPRTVKNRVHLDLVATSLDDFGGLEQVTADGEFPWTTFLDPEGNQFCVFVGGSRPPGLKDLVIDSADPIAVSSWWADVWGGTLAHDESGYSYIDDVPGAPVESFDFVPVPEPKTVKNRLHWDVTLRPGVTVGDLSARGAQVLTPPSDDARWTVMADPEGNEFCVFEPSADVAE